MREYDYKVFVREPNPGALPGQPRDAWEPREFACTHVLVDGGYMRAYRGTTLVLAEPPGHWCRLRMAMEAAPEMIGDGPGLDCEVGEEVIVRGHFTSVPMKEQNTVSAELAAKRGNWPK